MILVIPESPSSPRKRGSSGPVSREIASLTLAIFDSCGHCEEPKATRQSPSTHAFPLPLGGVEKRLFAVIPAKAGIPELLKPVDSCLRRNDGKVEILHLSTPSLGGPG
jgi:hypothetical protein